MTRQYALPTMEQNKKILRKKIAKSNGNKKDDFSVMFNFIYLFFEKLPKKYRKIAKLKNIKIKRILRYFLHLSLK